jgi:hypothetical protein
MAHQGDDVAPLSWLVSTCVHGVCLARGFRKAFDRNFQDAASRKPDRERMRSIQVGRVALQTDLVALDLAFLLICAPLFRCSRPSSELPPTSSPRLFELIELSPRQERVFRPA